MPTDDIPESDLPISAAAYTDYVRIVRNGQSLRALAVDLPIPQAAQDRIEALELGQTSGQLGYETKALMDANVSEATGALALVTNDAIAANNGTYRWSGAAWVLSADRVTGLEARTVAVEAIASTVDGVFSDGTPDNTDLLTITDGSPEQLRLARFTADGTFIPEKYDPALAVAMLSIEEIDDTSTDLYRIVDASDDSVVLLRIKADGTILGQFEADSTYITPSINLWCLGDSLTNGAGGQIPWRDQIVPLISARTVTNWAVGGQTSRQIAARAGANFSLLTLAGDQLPASGAVAVTAKSVALVPNSSTRNGSINGVYGVLASDSAGNYTFARSTSGTSLYVAPKTPFQPDVLGHDFDTFIIFIGANNSNDFADVTADIDACVALQKTAEKRFLIITPPTGGDITPGVPSGEGVGTTKGDGVRAIEDWATAKYGDRVINSRAFSLQFHNGSADDLDDVAKGTMPRSLRVDSIHGTTFYNGKLAERIAYEINRRSW